MSETSHVWRMFALLALAVAAAFFAQRLLRPEGFGEVGHYRAQSLFEIMEQEPVHQGKDACAECHPDIHGVHEKDIHYDVKCEDCHGPGALHVRRHLEEDLSISDEAAAMPREYTLEGCLFCHRKLAARPRTFPQVDPEEHYAFLNVTDPATRCIECHNPHEPLFLLRKVSDARIHPVIFECAGCHDTPPAKSHLLCADHPVIFVCGDCHAPVVDDFETHAHGALDCTICHLFHRENEAAGRIFKNGNRRFCLLCHEKRDFRKAEGIPQIVSDDHLREMAETNEMSFRKIAAEPKACLLCHFDDIHDSSLIEFELDLEKFFEED